MYICNYNKYYHSIFVTWAMFIFYLDPVLVFASAVKKERKDGASDFVTKRQNTNCLLSIMQTKGTE